MLAIPQLSTGALAQFPITRRRQLRTSTAVAEDGRRYKRADAAGDVLEWQLTYEGLSDDEVARLEDFFVAVKGRLAGFTFVDPAANLLAWSEQLDEEVWQKDPYLAVAPEAPQAGHPLIWRVSNGGLASQRICQTLNAPGDYEYAFSAYFRSDSSVAVGMEFAGNRADRQLASEWQRIVVSGTADPLALAVRFSVELPPGASVQIYGLQAEPQPGASGYKSSVRNGIYEGARLSDDEFVVTTTDINRHSCTLNIIHGNHC
jgi:hypothetical protein